MHDYTRYGLQDNPFRKRELDPLNNPADESELAEIDGFSTHKPQVDAILEAAVKEKGPAFFLVAGNSGTGRSSVANWILARYCDLRGIERNRLIVPRRKVSNRDDFDTFLNWFAFLHNSIGDKEEIDLGKKLGDALEAVANTVQRVTMVPKFSDLAKRLSTTLTAQKSANGTAMPAAFGICLEKIEEYRIIRTAIDIFEDVPTVGVFTTFDLANVGKEAVDLFRQGSGRTRHVVELGSLSAPEVVTIIGKRWSDASKYPDKPPFDPNAIEQVLGHPPRTPGRILVIMARLIDFKLGEHLGSYPDNVNLFITAAQLRQHILNIETDYGE